MAAGQGRDCYDYIVVGAGSAGCAVASRLSDDPDVTVLLLEEGGADRAAAIQHPFVPALFEAWQNPSITRDYPVTGRPEMPAPSILRGVVRGGTSSINAMVYIRGNRQDFDGWASIGCTGWSYAELLPIFKAIEDFEGGASEHHGTGGPLQVRRMVGPTRIACAFVRAGIELGYEGTDPDAPGGRETQWDFNGAGQEDGAGLYQVTVTRDGRRASAAQAFLDSRSRPNLVEKLGVLVARVVVESGRAAGVACLEAGLPTSYRASREVVIAAGAFGSPKLLMLSGIGPGDELRRHGIEVVADVPGVGRNLHDHLLALQYFALRKREPEPNFIAEAGLFTRALAARQAAPDLQFHVAAGMAFFTPRDAPTENVVVCPTLVQPKSRGRITLLASDPRLPPMIDPGYLQEPDDVRVLTHGMALSRELAATRAFADFAGRPGEVTPGLSRGGDSSYVRGHARTVWHPVGSCRMGPDSDEGAVLDPQLRVRGVEGLRVADASVMPVIPSGNPNAACMMIGEKAARMIRADREALA